MAIEAGVPNPLTAKTALEQSLGYRIEKAVLSKTVRPVVTNTLPPSTSYFFSMCHGGSISRIKRKHILQNGASQLASDLPQL